jgi:hypothetical protein
MQKKHTIDIRNINSIGVADVDVYNTNKKKLEALKLKNKVKVKIRVGVFFDGTGNNGFNSDAIYYKKKLPLTVDNIKTEKHEGFDVETDTSYWNPYSNVKLLHDLYEETSINSTKNNKQDLHHYLQFPIYVQGIGTLRDKEDDKFGSGLGEGSRGVIARVEKACTDISGRIKDEFDRLEIEYKQSLYLESLKFDVFGFSRGAAAARHFCNEVLKSKVINENLFEKEIDFKQFTPKKQDKFKNEELLVQVENDNIPKVNKNFKTEIPIQRFTGGKLGESLRSKRINYPKKNVSIEFLGIFDTVISQILEKSWIIDAARIIDTFTPDYIFIPFTATRIKNPVNYISPIKKVNPDVSHPNIKKVFHISAQSEWRENFALTPISPSKHHVALKVLGAHSDIGGGYWHKDAEIKILHYFDVSPGSIHDEEVNEFRYKLRKWYIDQKFCNDTTDEIRWETKHHIFIQTGISGPLPVGDYIVKDETFMGNETSKVIDGKLHLIVGYHFQLVSARKLDNRLSLVYMNVMKETAKKIGGVPLNLSPSDTDRPKEYDYHDGYTLKDYQSLMEKIAIQLWGAKEGKKLDRKIFQKKNGKTFYKVPKKQVTKIKKNFVHLSANFNSTIPILDFFDHSDFAFANVPNMTFEDEYKEPPYEREHYTPVLAKFDKN